MPLPTLQHITAEAIALLLSVPCPVCGKRGDPPSKRHPNAPPSGCLWCDERHAVAHAYRRHAYQARRERAHDPTSYE